MYKIATRNVSFIVLSGVRAALTPVADINPAPSIK